MSAVEKVFGPPPLGIDLADDRLPRNNAVVIAMFILSIVTVILRFVARLRIQKAMVEADDWTITAALVGGLYLSCQFFFFFFWPGFVSINTGFRADTSHCTICVDNHGRVLWLGQACVGHNDGRCCGHGEGKRARCWEYAGLGSILHSYYTFGSFNRYTNLILDFRFCSSMD